MQNAMRVDAMPQEDEIPDEELIDTLIAISVVAKRLAMKLRKIKDEGDKQNSFMKFKDMLRPLREGKKVKLPFWSGYWQKDWQQS